MSSQLEKYLREIAVQLHELPADEREEQIEEIRIHMNASIEKYKALGKDDTEAEQAALAQFGDAAMVGRDIRRARTRKSMRSIAFAALIALALATATSCFYFRDVVSPATGNKTTLLVLLQVGETFLMGTCVGLILRQLAVKWIVWYYTITLIPSLAILLLPHLRGVHMSLIGTAASAGGQLLVGAIRIAIAYAGAWIGAKIAERLIGKNKQVAEDGR